MLISSATSINAEEYKVWPTPKTYFGSHYSNADTFEIMNHLLDVTTGTVYHEELKEMLPYIVDLQVPLKNKEQYCEYVGDLFHRIQNNPDKVTRVEKDSWRWSTEEKTIPYINITLRSADQEISAFLSKAFKGITLDDLGALLNQGTLRDALRDPPADAVTKRD